jgi:hypothetical protein
MVDASSCQAGPSPASSVQSVGACNGGALQARSVQCCVVAQTRNWQGPGRPPEHNVPGTPAPGSIGFWSTTGHGDFPRPSFFHSQTTRLTLIAEELLDSAPWGCKVYV